MSDQKEKKERKVTPIGEAKWAHLITPKAPYQGKGDPKYQIDVVFSVEDEAWAKWAKDLQDAIKALPVQVNKKTGEKLPKQTPIKKEFNQHDEPTGRFYVTFKTSDKFKPGVFDIYGKKLDDAKVGNGSKVRVSYIESEYESFGGGIALYLNAVQVVSLVEFASGSAASYGFDTETPPEDTELEPF